MSIHKNPNGTWYFSVRIKCSNGEVKQFRRQSKNWKLKRDAIEAERLFLSQFSIDVQSITYKDLYYSFINHKSQKIKKRSVLTYTEVHNKHILPYFGDVVINNISKEDIRKWQRTLLSHDLSNSYLKTIQANFRRVLNWGVNNDMVTRNPFTIEYIKREEQKKEMHFYTLDEYNQFSATILDETDKLIFSTLYWCGLRKGELQALQFKDVDFIKRSINISKTYDYRNHIVTPPKTQTSFREVMLPGFLVDSFRSYINRCSKIAGYNENLYLFGLDNPISSTTLERKKNKYATLSNVKKIRVHDFRHSHVSLMINNGISDFDIAKRLGHSRDMVNNIYGHWFVENQIKIAETLHMLQSCN